MRKYLQVGVLALALTASATVAVFVVGHAIAALSIDHPYIAIGIGVVLLLVIPAGFAATSILDYLEERRHKKWWDDMATKDHKTRLAHRAYYENKK